MEEKSVKKQDLGLVPARKAKPEDEAGFVSRMFFAYLTPLMELGKQRPLEESDLARQPRKDDPEVVSAKFDAAWSQVLREDPPEKRSVTSALKIAYGKPFYISGILKFIYDALTFFQPISIGYIIAFVANPNPSYVGYIWVAALFVSMIIQAFVINVYFYRVMKSGMHARTGLVSAIYRKALVLSNAARQGMTVGEITTLMSVDTSKIEALAAFLHVIWSGCLQIVAALALLYVLLGPSTFAGFGMMLLLLPAQGRVTTILGKLRKETMRFTDKRVKTINEVMQGIRVIKFFAWESSFAQRILDIRAAEIVKVRASALVRAGNTALLMLSPTFVAVVTFEVYAASGNELTADIVFPALVLFNILRFPLMMLPMVIAGLAEAKVSVSRIGKFLQASELEASHVVQECTEANAAVFVSDAEFTWGAVKNNGKTSTAAFTAPSAASSPSSPNSPQDERRAATLRGINFQAPRGKLVAVVGSVGCGKSSLLSAILGEMQRNRGVVEISGSKAFVPQEAWIQNASLKDNILFGAPFDNDKYKRTIQVCALERDIEMLPAGDLTEIGERGINLSGGQKQRVNLARAVYADVDIYFLDDCLSAVDSHVGRHIFDQCISKELEKKTRILVTHQLQFVPRADLVVVMKEGEIVESGLPSELMHKENGLYQNMMLNYSGADASESAESAAAAVAADEGADVKKASVSASAAVAPVAKPADDAAKGKLVSQEDRETGTVSRKVAKGYLVAAGGVAMCSLIGVLYLIVQGFRVASDIWLAIWSADTLTFSAHQYMMVYGLLALGTGIFELAKGLTFAFAGVWAAISLHTNAMARVLRAKMSFIDATPVGRILNRFSKDVDTVDNVLPVSLQSFLNVFLMVFSFLIVICVIIPYFCIVLVPLLAIYYYEQEFYRHSSRELKRLDSVSRTPLYSHFSETLGGLSTIRAYGHQQDFAVQNNERLGRNLRAYWAQVLSQRWLGIRLELLAAWVVGFVALFVVIAGSSLNDGLAGLVLLYSQSMTGLLNWTVRMATDSEAQMNSVERLLHFSDNVPVEPAAALEADAKVPDSWPSTGSVAFDSVVMSYREDRDPVLQGVSFSVQGGEKIGVVGRTGAGKSSLMVALFRLCELRSGSISIDGVDIAKIGLDLLRKRALCIIPQDPFLFSGTVRSNLDPFDDHEDQDVWRALERAHLKDVVADLPLKLSAPVSEYGGNFSTGQRQLFCLARALLRHARILVLDEATASVDADTDRLIQQTIRTEFSECTILTIAHRLNTIIDYSRVIVMDSGKVVEIGTPAELLGMDPPGVFAGMIDQTGEQSARHLRSVAMRISIDIGPVDDGSAAPADVNVSDMTADAQSSALFGTNAEASEQMTSTFSSPTHQHSGSPAHPGSDGELECVAVSAASGTDAEQPNSPHA
eukprot:ANDGO_05406.mRNA.1 ABC transporter C family member 2